MRFSLIKSSLIFAAAAVAIQTATTPALAADTFRSGDPVVVSQPGAPLMRGTRTLTTLSQGQRLNVLQTEGDWVGTKTVVNGQTVAGWIHKRQVATPTQYAQRRTTRRYSYQPGAPTSGYSSPGRGYSRSSSNGGLIMGVTPYGQSYWRADRKISGF